MGISKWLQRINLIIVFDTTINYCPKRLTATYKINGTVSLIAALAVHYGNVITETIESDNAVIF